jgi:heme-degrading monooxygenase HmoA
MLPPKINDLPFITSGMAKLVEIDEKVKFSDQITEDAGPIVFINKFTVNPEDVDGFLETWRSGALYFKIQPGLISTQLHRGIGGSGTFINYAIWESTAELRKAVSNIDMQERLSKYPGSTVVSPYIFKKMAVSGICVD